MKFILPTRIAEHVEPQLRAIVPDAQVVHLDDAGAADGDMSDAEVFFRWWSPNHVLERVLAAAPRLRWIHTPSAGVDQMRIPELLERDLLLTSSAGAHSIPIAEFVLMLMLAHVKHARTLAALHPSTAWPQARALQLGELYGKQLLIVGLGSIGQAIAARAAAFGMRVAGSRRHPAPLDGVDQVVGEHGWRELLPGADFVVVATPLTPATSGMIDAAAFERMRPSAYLINIARGPIVDTDALIAALTAGRIAGAALDALPQEPLPPEHPLWTTPNVWVTPHISFSSPHLRDRSIAIFLDNLPRFRAGRPLVNLVDWTAGY